MNRFFVGLLIGGLVVGAVLATIARSSEQSPPVAPIELRPSAPQSSEPRGPTQQEQPAADTDDSSRDSAKTPATGARPAPAPQPASPPPPAPRAQPAPPPPSLPAGGGADPVELPPAAAGDDDGADDASDDDGGDDGGDD